MGKLARSLTAGTADISPTEADLPIERVEAVAKLPGTSGNR